MFLPRFLELLGNAGVARVVDQTPLLLMLMLRLLLRMMLLVMRLGRLVLLLKGDFVDGIELNRLKIRRTPITGGSKEDLHEILLCKNKIFSVITITSITSNKL